LDNKILDKAILFAVEKHSGMKRKGKNLPFILHPMETVAIVGSITDDVELMAAAALHDVIENADVTYEEILERFGKRIADIVAAESENKRTDQSAADTWKIRKTEYLKNLQSASLDVKTVALADKLSNLREIYMDRCYVADEIWNRFNCKEKIEHEWFYRCIVFLTKDLSYTHAWIDLEWHVNKVFGVDSNVDIFDVCDKPEPDFIENGYDFDSAFFKWNCPIHDYMSRLIEDIYPNLEVIGSIEFNGNDYLEAIIYK